MIPIKGFVFIGLNLLRLLSLLALVFVFASTIMLMVRDTKAYGTLRQQGSLSESIDSCDYFPESDVPTTTWGVFWTQLGRFWVLILCIACFGSEISLNLLCRLYSLVIPILGPSFGTGPLGVIQVMISSSLLSHYLEGFPLFAPWMLFFVGLLNVLVGLAFGAGVKLRRSLLRSKRDMLVNAHADVEKSFPFGKGVQKLATKGFHSAASISKRTPSPLGRIGTEEANRLQSNIRPVRTAMDAFHSRSTYNVSNGHGMTSKHAAYIAPSCADDEVLRWRARQENLLAERMAEGGSASGLSRHFRWDSQNDIAIPRRTPSNDIDSLKARIEEAQAGMCHDLTSPRTTVPRRSFLNAPPSPRSGHAKRSGFKRRTLVLSKMVQQVKRGSVSAASAAGVGRRPRMQRLDGRKGNKAKLRHPTEGPGPWTEVGRTDDQVHVAPPPASYRPGKPRTAKVGSTSDDGLSRYHSLL